MNSEFIVSLIPELERLSYAFRSALHDRSLDRDDLLQEGIVKLLETSSEIEDETEARRWAIRVFMNNCRDLERKAICKYKQRFVDVEDEILAELPGPYSFASLLTKMAIEECLTTISEMDRSLVMEFINPTRRTALAAVRRIYHSNGHGASNTITPRDVAKGRKVSPSTVDRALRRARYALIAGGI